jgi:hypothetical protein
MERMLRSAMQMARGLHIPAEIQLMVFEMIHYYLSHRVYCVSSPLAEQLMNSDITLTLDHLSLPSSIFEVDFEEGFEILPGVQAPGVLCIVRPDETVFSPFKKFIHGSMGFEVPWHVEPGMENMFSVRFTSPLADRGMLHVTLNTEEQKDQPIDELIDSLTLPKYALRMEPLTPTEKEIEKRIVRTVLGMLCYLHTADPDIREGKVHNRPAFSDLLPTAFLVGESIPREVAWHLRKAHWRFLRDPRYRRDEAGNIRTVWVRPAEVSREHRPAGELPPKEEIVEEQP